MDLDIDVVDALNNGKEFVGVGSGAEDNDELVVDHLEVGAEAVNTDFNARG